MKILNLITAVITIFMLACQIVSGQKMPDKFPTGQGEIITETEFGELRAIKESIYGIAATGNPALSVPFRNQEQGFFECLL